jgi:hypothetical protein
MTEMFLSMAELRQAENRLAQGGGKQENEMPRRLSQYIPETKKNHRKTEKRRKKGVSGLRFFKNIV